MTEPAVSNPSVMESNRFGMSSMNDTHAQHIQPTTTFNNNNNNNNNFNNNIQHQHSGNQVGILDILSGGGGNNSQQLMKGSSIPFSSTMNTSSPMTDRQNSPNRNLNPSARKSLPSTSTLSPYQIQSSLDSSFSPRFSRQYSQPPLSFNGESSSDLTNSNNNNTTMMNNDELSGGEEELEMNPQLLVKNGSHPQDQQQQYNSQQGINNNGQQPSSNNGSGNGNTRRMNYACTECRKAHKACTGERPCDRCKKLGMEDKCKSTIRKKRILTKRYWVHFMSNDSNNSMMDDSSATGDYSPASIQPPPLNIFSPGQQQAMGKSASMNYKRHSSANLPSFSAIKRLNQGLSGGSSNSMSSLSFQGSEVVSSSNEAAMLNPNDYNMYNGDRSPRQAPHSYNYHPYKSPRQLPGGEASMEQPSPNTLQNSNNNSPGNGFTSPRNTFNRSASSSQLPTPQQLLQQPSFPGLDAYRLDGKLPNPSGSAESSPRESGILNHLNMSTFNNSAGSQLDPQTVNRHYNRGSMRIQPLFNQHTKSLSDTNLLPSPSMLLNHQQQTSMFNNIPPQQQPTNNNMAVDEFSNQNYSAHQSNLHIPPIMLEKNSNVPQFTIQPSPIQSNNSNSNTPRSGLYFESSPRSNIGSGGGEYYYSPRSEIDYSSDMSSLTNSPRFGGGADSNSSTPRSLIGSMNGMTINDSSPLQQLSQQQFPPGYRGSLRYDSPSLLGVPGNRKSVAGYLNQAGNRFSLGSVANHGSAYTPQQQLQQQQLPQTGATPNSSSYTNHPGNRYSLGPNQDLYQYSTRTTNFRK